MADKKISDLTAIVTQSATDLSEVSLNGLGSRKETRSQNLNYMNLNLTTPLNNIYAAKNGSNVTGTGLATNPYADASAAMIAITGTSSNPKNIFVSDGIYSVTDLAIKPLVTLTGSLLAINQVTNPVTLDSSWLTAASGSKGQFKDFILQADAALDFSSAAHSSLEIDFTNSEITGILTVIGKASGNTTFTANQSTFGDDVGLESLESEIFGSRFKDSVIVIPATGDSNASIRSSKFEVGLFFIFSATGNTTAKVQNSVIYGSTSVTRSGGGSGTVYYIGTPIFGSLLIDGTGSTVYIDDISYPQGGINYANGGTSAQVVFLEPSVIHRQNTFSKAQGVAPVAVTSSSNHIATDASLSNIFTHTLTENTTLDNPTNLVTGRFYTWKFTQAAAAKTLAFGNKFKWPGGTALTISTGNGQVDIITGLYDGTNINTAISGQNFS